MPKAAIYCKASISDGMGHVYRQLNLANGLKKHGWEIMFYIPSFAPAVELITRSGFTPSLVELEPLTYKYHDRLFDLAVIDIGNTTESLVSAIKKSSHWVVSFDDLGTGRNYVNILIDCNLAPSESKSLNVNTLALFGTDYSVLHPDFAIYHKKTREFNSTSKSLLITMGATDPQGLALPLTRLLLKEKKNLQLTVITGNDTSNALQFDRLATQFKSLKFLGSVSNMAKFLWAHETVICAGGVTLHEAAAVGTPAFVINQVEHQQSKARFVEKSGAAINLGMGNNYDAEKLREALYSEKSKLRSMSLKGKKLIDGLGLFRVIEAITELIEK